VVGSRWWLRAVVAVGLRPTLWVTALRQVFVLAPRGWWRRRPYLPRPDPAYLRFRLQTAYGAGRAEPDVADLITYLRWCKAWPMLAR
jgi:hypothetical protein